MKNLNRFCLVGWIGAGFFLWGCGGTQKTPAPTQAAKKEINPSIPEMKFLGDTAKNRVSLQDVGSKVWTLKKFTSISKAAKGQDKLYISTSFGVPENDETNSECNATGQFAQILIKSPSKLKLSAQVPLHISPSAESPFSKISVLQYGAIADLGTGGCTPVLKWSKPEDPNIALEFLAPMISKSEIIEKKLMRGNSSLRAALIKKVTANKDEELHLIYETTGTDMLTLSTFVYVESKRSTQTTIIEVPTVPKAQAFDPSVDVQYSDLVKALESQSKSDFVRAEEGNQKFRIIKATQVSISEKAEIKERDVKDFPEFLMLNNLGEFNLANWNSVTMSLEEHAGSISSD